MKTLLLLCLAGTVLAADPSTPVPASGGAKPAAMVVQASTPGTADEAISLLKRLPDPLILAQLNDYFATASVDDASKVLMHIAISAVRPARPAVMPMLLHRDPLVVDRALRAITVIGWTSTEARQQVERILADGKPDVAVLAATCLGSGGDMRAVPALIDKLAKKPAEVAAAAQTALQRLTQVDFKNDTAAWQAWYQNYRTEAAQRLAVQADLLDDPDPKQQIAAIQALAGTRGERQEALELIEPMARSQDAAVAMAARQALATLSPNEYVMPSTAEVVAATKPAVVVEAKTSGGVMNYLASQGLFDTWYGIALTVFTSILLLSGLLFLLRTGPVKNATRRFGRVVVAGTKSFVRPITSRIRAGTKRIVRQFSQPPKADPNKK